MKKKILLLTLLFGVLLFYSCNKKNEGAGSQDGESLGFEYATVSGIVNPGFALVVNTGFYTLAGADDGEESTKMKWAASLSLGQDVMTGNTRRLTLDSNNRVYNVIEVRNDNGTEGYALASQVVPGGRLAVVVDERANLFRTPRTVDVSGTILSHKTVVVFYPETENNGFVEVRGYDRPRDRFIDSSLCHVRLSSLSRRISDIQSAILMQTAMTLPADQTVRRAALLQSALDDYADSVFIEEIYELAYPGSTGAAGAAGATGAAEDF